MNRSLARRAFTLTEVLIVIFIVLALGGLVAYNLMGTKEKAQDDLVKVDMQTLSKALRKFRFDHNRYPTDDEGLKALWDKEAIQDEEVQKKWLKYLESPMPKDQYGHEWGYRQQSEHGDADTFDLWSVGRDAQEGTDDDIVSWDKDAEAGPGGGSSSGSKGG